MTQCFHCVLLHFKSPQSEQLKMTHTAYLTASMGQELGHGLVGSSARLQSHVGWTESHLEAHLGKVTCIRGLQPQGSNV